MKHVQWTEHGMRVLVREEETEEAVTLEDNNIEVDEWADAQEHSWLLGPCRPLTQKEKDVIYYVDE